MGAQIARIGIAIALAAAGVLASAQGRVTASLAKDSDGSAELAPNQTASGRTSAALRAVAANDFAGAIDPARQSLAKRPIDAATVRILAAAQLATNDAGGAGRSLSLASRLGWRDPGTQLLLFQVARDAGDVRAAAQRYDALARQRVNAEHLKKLMHDFLLDEGAPAALAERLSINPLWRREYLMTTDPIPAESYRPWLEMLASMKAAGSPPRVAEYTAFERTLVRFGKVPLAIEASRKVGALNRAARAGFDDLAQGEDVSPFEWSVAPGREASISQPKVGMVRVASDGQTGGELVRRMFPVSAGPHRFTVRIDEASSDADRAFAWTVTCLPGGGDLEPEVSGPSEGRETGTQVIAFVAPAQCIAARIALETVPGRIRRDYSLSVSNAGLD
jgi:hypothetical protein